MTKIFQLPESVVSKISAGEVIERPAYAVKELIENSIDAGASVIEIHIEEAGLRRIIVQDNGEGMSREDLELSFLPHATSKLKDETELVGIKTLGFRGEALSSIAAISTLTIRSRVKNQPGGYEIIVRNGHVENFSPIGTPIGTIVTVDNLFLNVPARKKFLKSEKTEFRLITDIITNFALSYPEIHFTLIHNKKPILDLPKNENNLDRIRSLLGSNIYDQLIPISYEEGFISLSGFLGRPQVASKQNRQQFIFVNNRLVSDRMISLSVKESFGTLLPAANTPVFLLRLNLPPEIVDVNIHPRKEQISFLNSQHIFDAIKSSVIETLNNHNLTFKLAKFKQENSSRLGETTSFSGELLKSTVLPWDRTETINVKPSSKLSQLHQTYIVAQTKDGLVLIDQHAAHERILYEQFVTAFTNEKNKKQIYELAKNVKLNLSLNESQILEEHLDYFNELGFAIDHFQGTSFLIRTAPLVFKGRNIGKIIKDLLTDLENEAMKTIDLRSQRMLAFLSCRAAIKAGDVLSDKQMKDIVKTLDQTENNSTCPHGRPTRIQITIEELNKLFKRS